MELQEIIKRCQRRVAEKDDGVPGIHTWTAIAKVIGVDLSEEVADIPMPVVATNEKVDPRSEIAIATLHQKVMPLTRQLIQLASQQNITIKITSGTRTYAEQDALFAKGGVTKARGGQSNHNFGLAFDVTIFDGSQPVWESPKYKIVGKLGESVGLSWGGRWTSIVDEPHFELRPPWAAQMSESQMLSELRRRHDNGIDAFT